VSSGERRALGKRSPANPWSAGGETDGMRGAIENAPLTSKIAVILSASNDKYLSPLRGSRTLRVHSFPGLAVRQAHGSPWATVCRRSAAGILTMRISCNRPMRIRLHEKENEQAWPSTTWNLGAPGTPSPVAPRPGPSGLKDCGPGRSREQERTASPG
jgi:hypothetical protein